MKFFSPDVGLNFEEDGMILFTNRIHLLPKLSIVHCPLSTIHGFRHVADSQAQRQAAKKDLCANFVVKHQAHGASKSIATAPMKSASTALPKMSSTPNL